VKLVTGQSEHQPPHAEDIPVTDTLKLIVPRRRQLILEELATADQTPLSTSALAERVATTEYDCSPESLTSNERKRVYIALSQSHLPTLSNDNVVSYQPDDQRVDRGPEFSRVWQTYIAVLNSLSTSTQSI
jgi:hypothetical protein